MISCYILYTKMQIMLAYITITCYYMFRNKIQQRKRVAVAGSNRLGPTVVKTGKLIGTQNRLEKEKEKKKMKELKNKIYRETDKYFVEANGIVFIVLLIAYLIRMN